MTLSQSGIRPATLSEANARRAAELLQEELAELLTLTLQAKHYHWNIYGSHFRGVHLHLDEITDHVRAWSDEVAERIVTLGTAARGQADALTGTGIEPLPNTMINDLDANSGMADRLTFSAIRARERAEELGDVDLVSQNMVLDIIQGMEKDIWMLRANEPDGSR